MEVWEPVVGYEGLYEVSDLGRVRSVPRVQVTNTCTRRLKGQVLKPRNISGHHKVMLSDTKFKRKDLLVHRLVLLAFVGEPPVGHEACHRNDIGTDNRLTNLYWGTRSENAYDQISNGLHYNASKTHCRRGHPYTGDNVIQVETQRRRTRLCRVCSTASRMKYSYGGEQEDYISALEVTML